MGASHTLPGNAPQQYQGVLVWLARPPDTAAWDVSDRDGLSFLPTPCALAHAGHGAPPVMAASITAHGWSVRAWLSLHVLPAALDATYAARAAFTCAQAPEGMRVWRPRLAVELPATLFCPYNCHLK
jgi:hypothetical protein